MTAECLHFAHLDSFILIALWGAQGALFYCNTRVLSLPQHYSQSEHTAAETEAHLCLVSGNRGKTFIPLCGDRKFSLAARSLPTKLVSTFHWRIKTTPPPYVSSSQIIHSQLIKLRLCMFAVFLNTFWWSELWQEQDCSCYIIVSLIFGILNQFLWPQSAFNDSNLVNRVKVNSSSLSVQKVVIVFLK